MPRVIFNKLKNCTAAEAAQFLYETCATYHRYGQGFKSSVNRTERSVPFCDRGVFRMFISSTASCTCSKVYFIVSIVSCKSLPEGIRKSQQSSCLRKMLACVNKKSQQKSCLRKMLNRRQKKSQQSSCLIQMLTRRYKKSQQKSCLSKMLTRRHKKSQQKSCLRKMLTRRYKKSQQSSCLRKMLTRRHKKSQQNRCLRKMLTLLQ